MDYIICFIDDSEFEHDLMLNEIAPSVPEFEIVQSYTFEEARVVLGDRIPLLFLLDLWGKDESVKNPSITPIKELENETSKISVLEKVYDGLENFEGDTVNEYLKRLFTVMDGWRKIFEMACSRAGQTRKYGLENLENVRKYYPGIPGLFYTRKSLISDSVAIFQAGGDGLLIKPTGKNDIETRIMTKRNSSKMIEEIKNIIDNNIGKSDKLKNGQDLYYNERVEALISSWKEFINK